MSKEKKTKVKDNVSTEETTNSQLERIVSYLGSGETEEDGFYGLVYENDQNGFNSELKISTNSYKLDALLEGGYNAYSMSLFFGDKESGKTGQALTWGANWQKQFGEKGWVFFFDAEGRLTEKKIRMSGIDTSRLIVAKANGSEYVFQKILDLINNNPDGIKYFFIVDSINALTTADERGKTLGEAEARAGVARVSSMAFKKLSLPIHVKGHHVYLCSQIRAGNMTGFGGAGNKAGGGKAPEFYGDLIGQMGLAWDGNSPDIKEGVETIGRYTEYDFRKTYNEKTGVKVAIPIKYDHTGGVWKANEVADMGVEWGLILKKGTWYSMQGELFKESAERAGIPDEILKKSVQGHFGLVSFLEENPDLQNMIYAYVMELLK